MSVVRPNLSLITGLMHKHWKPPLGTSFTLKQG